MSTSTKKQLPPQHLNLDNTGSDSTSEAQYRIIKVVRNRDGDGANDANGTPIPVPCGGSGFQWEQQVKSPGGEWKFLGTLCITEDDATALQQVTPGRVLRAFKRVPLPDSELVVQPPGGATLVNFDTIFSTSAEPFSESVTLLGQRVDFDIEATEFVFHHGDGTSETTDWAGRSFSEVVTVNDVNYIVHRYEQAPATVQASVDTTWGARFRVNGGPWREVPGTVTMAGSPVALEVKEARPALVAPDG